MTGNPRTILTVGAPALATPSAPVSWPDAGLAAELADMQRTLADFRARHGYGRALAAPQLGIAKRAIAINLGATPFALINPQLTWCSDETMEVWDDCLSVPDRIVRVRRHRSVSLEYLDEQGRRRAWRTLPPDLSELVQHELDHLDGVLMTERAVDADSTRPVADHARLVGAARPAHRLSLDAIREASVTIDPVFLNSPQYDCEPLSAALGCRVLLKVETANPIRCFKGRGADYFVQRILAAGETRPLVCASAGNFGQALAYACRKRHYPVTVFASVNANALKIERMRALGATLRLAGDDFDAAREAAAAHASASGALLVEDGRQAPISEGAGSMAVELLARGDAIDAVLVPLGGGAMLNGMARWLKAASPATRVLGVSASGADAMEQSWRRGSPVNRATVQTIADGIAVRTPIPEAVGDMRGLVDDVLLVSDDDIRHAMALLRTHAGLICEPAGAVGVAALHAGRARFAGRCVATPVCGSNVAPPVV